MFENQAMPLLDLVVFDDLADVLGSGIDANLQLQSLDCVLPLRCVLLRQCSCCSLGACMQALIGMLQIHADSRRKFICHDVFW